MLTVMKIEKISSNDIEEIKMLARRAVLELVSATDRVKNEIIFDTWKRIEKCSSESDGVFLKCTEADILGFILIQDGWNLSDLFVLPEMCGKGIGKLLFNAARSECKLKDHKGYIRVNASLNAEGFYRNLGFERFTSGKELPHYVVPLIYNFTNVPLT